MVGFSAPALGQRHSGDSTLAMANGLVLVLQWQFLHDSITHDSTCSVGQRCQWWWLFRAMVFVGAPHPDDLGVCVQWLSTSLVLFKCPGVHPLWQVGNCPSLDKAFGTKWLKVQLRMLVKSWPSHRQLKSLVYFLALSIYQVLVSSMALVQDCIAAKQSNFCEQE